MSPTSKTEQRARLRVLRKALAIAAPDAAERAAALLPLERLPAFAAFGGYHALGSELDPSPLIRRLAATGAMLTLPVALSRDAPLVFRAWDSRHTLVPDAVGVPAPPPSAPGLHPDLVIAPLLAFDRRGGRLGQGGGHYDRTLESLRSSRPVFVLGLAYAGQEVEPMDLDPHDQRLDAILTETGYREVQST